MYAIARTRKLARMATFVAALAAGGCEVRSPVEPTTVPDPQPLRPALTFSVSGWVTEMTDSGEAPVEGAWVENADTHDVVITDSEGFYRMTVAVGSARLSISKEGYESELRDLLIDGDLRVDVLLVRE